jgi:hypothetical protein
MEGVEAIHRFRKLEDLVGESLELHEKICAGFSAKAHHWMLRTKA